MFAYPEDAARALSRVVRHVDWRSRPRGSPPAFADARPDEAAALIAGALEAGGWLDPGAVMRLLGCYGIEMPEWRMAADREEVAEAAREIGGPVAVKAAGPAVVHKTELGAVRTGLESAAEAADAAAAIDGALAAAGVNREALLVQSMVEPGVEMLIGVVADPMFGPVLACGAGGTQAELLGDVAVRVCPIVAEEAGEMVSSLKTFPLLTGYRGAPAVDLDALEDLLLRVGAMVEAHREIVELDLNPVIASSAGATAVDARVRVSAAPPPRPWPTTWH